MKCSKLGENIWSVASELFTRVDRSTSGAGIESFAAKSTAGKSRRSPLEDIKVSMLENVCTHEAPSAAIGARVALFGNWAFKRS